MSNVIVYDLQFECILRMDQGSYKKGVTMGRVLWVPPCYKGNCH